MQVLHFSLTPLVGAPGRICEALNKLPNQEHRWVVFDCGAGNYGSMKFQLDLIWERDAEEVIKLAECCDVIHLHNYLDLSSQEFRPINFQELWNKNRCIVRQLHSSPEFIAKQMHTSIEDVLDCEIPQLVIAQFQERYYPHAKLVPNFVSTLETPIRQKSRSIKIGYAPTRFNSAKTSRWDTKGYPEVKKLLKQLKKKVRALSIDIDIDIDIIELVSHDICMQRKMACDIFIDDLFTGSYHLNTLEALSHGAVCLCFLDQRTLQAINKITGRDDFPVVNVGIENALEALFTLCQDPELVERLGSYSKKWMRYHWTAENIGHHYISAYQYSIEHPKQKFPERDNSSDPAIKWLNIGLPDAIWRSRQRNFPSTTPQWLLRIRATLGALIKNTVKKN